MLKSYKTIFNPYRLLILTYLERDGEMRFSRLQKILKLSSGNLASYIKILEKGDYVKSSSVLDRKRLKVTISITEKGRQVLTGLRSEFESILLIGEEYRKP